VTSLEAALRQIDADLSRAHVSFALVGGLAVSARTEPRFTRDADFAVAQATDTEAEALIHQLRTYDYHSEMNTLLRLAP
jgi:GAF domain-containing protein